MTGPEGLGGAMMLWGTGASPGIAIGTAYVVEQELGAALGCPCSEVLSELKIKNNPLLDIAVELERIALEDDYFIEKKLYPNVDFY